MSFAISTVAFLFALATTSPVVETAPPLPFAPPRVELPRIAERRLSNGFRVIVVERPQAVLCSVSLVISTGAADDPEGLEGLANIADTLLGKDTLTATHVEKFGAAISGGPDYDYSNIRVDDIPPSRLPDVLKELSGALRSPAFRRRGEAFDEAFDDDDQKEFDLAISGNRDSISTAVGAPHSMMRLVAPRVVFSNAYGHPIEGTSASLARITPNDVGEFRDRYYRANNMTLVIAGKVSARRAFRVTRRIFGDWRATEEPLVRGGALADTESKRRVVVIDMPSAGVAAVRVGLPALRHADNRAEVAHIVDSILSDDKSSRLVNQIRVRRGLAYSPGTLIEPRVGQGPFYAFAETKNESAAEVAGIMLDEMEKLSRTLPDDREMRRRIAGAVGRFYRSIETTDGIVDYLEQEIVSGRLIRPFEEHVRRIEHVTAVDVQQFAATHLATARASVIVAGDARKFLPALRERFGHSVEVIAAEELDLASPTLRLDTSILRRAVAPNPPPPASAARCCPWR